MSYHVMSLGAAATLEILLLHSSKVHELSVGGIAGFTTVNLNVNRGLLDPGHPWAAERVYAQRCEKRGIEREKIRKDERESEIVRDDQDEWWMKASRFNVTTRHAFRVRRGLERSQSCHVPGSWKA